jgi:predicted DNA-binding transcriptional regulator YafY
VRASELGRRRLKDISETVRLAVEAAVIDPDAEGWAELDVPIEEIDWATREMIRLGPEVEVLAPPELRERIVANAVRFARLYGVIGR